MTTIGTPLSPTATRVLFCGGGELGKEVVIELQRLGVEVIVVDRYANAPAMQVAHRSHTLSMLDGEALRAVIEKEKPALHRARDRGHRHRHAGGAGDRGLHRHPDGARRAPDHEPRGHPAPGGRGTRPGDIALPLCRHARGIRRGTRRDRPALRGQADHEFLRQGPEHRETAGRHRRAPGNTRRKADAAGAGKVIVEGFVDFDYEITQLTVRHAGGTSFCEPIGHVQVDGDYRQSWQPQPMSEAALASARDIAGKVTAALGGRGIFGVELFVKGDEVIFSEVSPTPARHRHGHHDLAGPVAVCPARPRHPRPAGSQYPPARPFGFQCRPGGRQLEPGRVRPISKRHWQNPIPSCGCSASPRSQATVAWALPWHAARISTRRWTRRRAPPLRLSPSCDAGMNRTPLRPGNYRHVYA